MTESKSRSIVLRLTGGVAVREHCPHYHQLSGNYNRVPQDLDFVGHLSQVADIQRLFIDLGFTENTNIMRLSGTERRLFYAPGSKLHVDVVLDKLFFCHTIDLRKRLALDFPTIPLADLLLSKLQIRENTEKDMIDVIALLLEHNVGDIEVETINVKYLAALTAADWGLWKTVTDNLNNIQERIDDYIIQSSQREDINSKLQLIQREIEAKSKPILWKLRNCIGIRMKWYNNVEELEN